MGYVCMMWHREMGWPEIRSDQQNVGDQGAKTQGGLEG